MLIPSAVSNHPKSYSFYSLSTQVLSKGPCNSQRNRILTGNVLNRQRFKVLWSCYMRKEMKFRHQVSGAPLYSPLTAEQKYKDKKALPLCPCCSSVCFQSLFQSTWSLSELQQIWSRPFHSLERLCCPWDVPSWHPASFSSLWASAALATSSSCVISSFLSLCTSYCVKASAPGKCYTARASGTVLL